jgi:hypothetical protein
MIMARAVRQPKTQPLRNAVAGREEWVWPRSEFENNGRLRYPGTKTSGAIHSKKTPTPTAMLANQRFGQIEISLGQQTMQIGTKIRNQSGAAQVGLSGK